MNSAGIPGMNLREMPRHSMNMISIQPLSGNARHGAVFRAWAAICAEYLSAARLNMKKKPARTAAVMRMSHQSFCPGIVRYASTPLMVMITPGVPHRAAAM